MVDFNKESPTYLEYRQIAHKILLKYYNKYNKDVYYAGEMLDFVADEMQRRNHEYDKSRGTRSCHRYIVCMTYAKKFYKKVRAYQNRIYKVAPVTCESDNFIDNQEKNRVYEAAIQILKDNMHIPAYKYFYESVVNDRPTRQIAKEYGKTHTAIANNINKVRETLRVKLIQHHGADI